MSGLCFRFTAGDLNDLQLAFFDKFCLWFISVELSTNNVSAMQVSSSWSFTEYFVVQYEFCDEVFTSVISDAKIAQD